MTDDFQPAFEELAARKDALYERCHYRSARRIAEEMRSLARRERQLIPYMNACYSSMVMSSSLHDPLARRDRAVELVALLESEERARAIQADYPEDRYEMETAWMATCAYDNLANATADTHGLNSPGTHEVIAEGLQVCRRTGNLDCISCFREYATDVYLAADDLELALHNATVNEYPPGHRPHGRRYVGALDASRIYILRGELDAALAAADRALLLAEEFHHPASARLSVLLQLESLLLVAGQHHELEARSGHPSITRKDPALAEELALPPEGEYPEMDRRLALRDAQLAASSGDHESTMQILVDVDRESRAASMLGDSCENQLRMMASCRLAGDRKRLLAIGRKLETRAKEARDWLTLRRAGRLLDPGEAASPLALVGPLPRGPFAPEVAASGLEGSDTPGQGAPGATAGPSVDPEESATAPIQGAMEARQPESTPLEGTIAAFWTRLQEASEEEDVEVPVAAVRAEILAIVAEDIEDPADAVSLLHLMGRLVGEDEIWSAYSDTAEDEEGGSAEVRTAAANLGRECWEWANRVAARFPEHPGVMNVLADLGDTVSGNLGSQADAVVAPERILGLFRRSLDLDPDDAPNHARAGDAFLRTGNLSEAERCLARAFRLDRTSGWLAMRLAHVYSRTDREADSLAVLDLALREGCRLPEVTWRAAMTAGELGKHQAQLTYLDLHEKIQSGPWLNYYRSLALLELARPEEALAAAQRELEANERAAHAVRLLSACALGALGELEQLATRLDEILAVRLVDLEQLTTTGLANLYGRLWDATAVLDDDERRGKLELLLLQSGLAPGSLFAAQRKGGQEHEGVGFYRCTLLQAVGDQWSESPGCLAGQASWRGYTVVYGVLALDEDQARDLAVSWQERCCPEPPVTQEVVLADEGYTDRVGAVWQSFHEESG